MAQVLEMLLTYGVEEAGEYHPGVDAGEAELVLAVEDVGCFVVDCSADSE